MKKIFGLCILMIGIFTLNNVYAQEYTFTYGRNHNGYDVWHSATINDELCTKADEFIDDFNNERIPGCHTSITIGGKTFYEAGCPGFSPASPPIWRGSQLSIGTFTTWWKGYSNFCMSNGFWSSSNASSLPDENNLASITFTMKTTGPYKGELVGKKDYESVSIRGSQSLTTKTITSPSFNSPFIYFKNLPTGNIKLNIDSEWQNYTNETPTFNAENGWNLVFDGKNVSVDNQKTDKLFYELALKKVELTRNGKNFASKEELVSFLKNGEFFDKLGFSEEQKENSLNYILPKVGEAKNYYLTILEDTSINNISKLNVFPTPNNIVRKYFAIYPTSLPVKTYGDIVYPQIEDESGFSVYENGEIYLDNDTFVIWK